MTACEGKFPVSDLEALRQRHKEDRLKIVQERRAERMRQLQVNVDQRPYLHGGRKG